MPRKKIEVADVINSLPDDQKYVHLCIDEIYVKESIYGYAVDMPEEKAKTIVGVMANCDRGGPKFMAKLVPVARLTSQYQKSIFLEVVDTIVNAGGRVTSCTVDGNAVNRKMLTLFADHDPNHPYRCFYRGSIIYIFFDSIHLVKSIRNNFINSGTLHYVKPGESMKRSANWSDIEQLYIAETSKSTLARESKLNALAVNPPVLSQQRVDIALRVFCEETALALQISGFEETAVFVKLVSYFFKIMNVKDSFASVRLRDPRRAAITQTDDDDNLNFIIQFSNMCATMKPAGAKRKMGDCTLTNQTAEAIVITVAGTVELVKFLLSAGYDCLNWAIHK